MKWNWGTGIFIVIVLFLGACTAFMVYTRGEVWSLVEEDYYPKELRHEEKLVKMRNAHALSMPVTVKLETANLLVIFPPDFRGKKLEGTVNVYRPSDETKDVILPVSVDTALTQRIPVALLSKGRYVVKVDWQSEGTLYYEEHDMYIP
jgi:hypothetical protein